MTRLEFSAGGVVMKQEKGKLKLLLIKDSYGHWTLPKGKLKKGESAKDAAIREIGEETGLKNIELIDDLGKTHYFYRLKGKLVFKTVYLFLFRLRRRERLRVRYEEIQDAVWFSHKEALRKVAYKGTRKFLNKCVRRFLKEQGE